MSSEDTVPSVGVLAGIDVFKTILRDAAVPGFAAECDPDEADAMGVFAEEALDCDEALTAAFDLDREDIAHA